MEKIKIARVRFSDEKRLFGNPIIDAGLLGKSGYKSAINRISELNYSIITVPEYNEKVVKYANKRNIVVEDESEFLPLFFEKKFKDEFDTQIRDIELISGRIEEIIYSHKTNDINIFCVSFEGRHFCIVNYDTKKSAYIKELMTDIFEKIKETLELCDSISSSIGASLNGKGAESIAYLAAEASAALEMAEFYGYSDIINF